MNVINSYNNAIYFEPKTFNDQVFNLIADYFNLSNKRFKIIETSTEMKPGYYQVVKEEVDQNPLLQVVKVLSYISIALPILMFVGKVIQNFLYKNIDVSHKFLSKFQQKLMNKEAENVPIIELSFDEINKFYDNLTIYQIEQWLIHVKMKSYKELNPSYQNLTKNELEQLLLKNTTSSPKEPDPKFTNFCNKFFERALQEWINDPKALGEKDLAVKDIKLCRNKRNPNLNIADYKLNSLPPIFPLIDHITKLKCSNNSFIELNDSIRCLNKLTDLDISDNQLKTISETVIEHLQNLKTLKLAGNPLKNFDFFKYLAKLSELDLSRCDLKKIPNSITELKSLNTLKLNKNPLLSFPEELYKFEKLERLEMFSCGLTAIPESVAKLANLKTLDLAYNQFLFPLTNLERLSSLKRLRLDDCKIKSFPTSILKINLEFLSLNENPLSDFPIEANDFTSLNELQMKSCGLTTIPDFICNFFNLQILSLRDNKLSSLPAKITNLKKLYVLDLIRNNFINFPEEICDLTKIQNLQLDDNNLLNLPGTINKLKSLSRLHIENNPSLYKLPKTLAEIPTDMQIYSSGTNIDEAEESKIIKTCRELSNKKVILSDLKN